MAAPTQQVTDRRRAWDKAHPERARKHRRESTRRWYTKRKGNRKFLKHRRAVSNRYYRRNAERINRRRRIRYAIARRNRDAQLAA